MRTSCSCSTTLTKRRVSSPARGEVWLVDLGMAAKVRPALVVSVPYSDTERALVTLVPHTTSRRESRFEVPVTVRYLRSGAFDAQGVVTVLREWCVGLELSLRSSWSLLRLVSVLGLGSSCCRKDRRG